MKIRYALIILVLLLVTGCYKKIGEQDRKVKTILSDIKDTINIDKYTIYGRFLNLEGKISSNDFDKMLLVLKTENDEIEYSLKTKKDGNNHLFSLSDVINDGLNLDKVPIGEYIILLKVVSGENNDYYTLKNNTSYKDLEYYTTTKNKKNNKIELDFSNYEEYSYLYMNVKDVTLPTDIYDIVIDPGHGGVDSGASKNGHFESKINLDYALKLKEALEEIGLKVKLTREKDEWIDNYGSNGRVNYAYKTKAKLMLSIHQNSAIYNVGEGGVEVYIPSNADITFAKNLADNVVNKTSSKYSPNYSNKLANGVYLRTLTKSDIDDMEKTAADEGWKPYEKANTNTTYYYIIRETGGIITNAYVDGRNEDREINEYYNSNHGCETYLLELGYMSSSSNLANLLKEKSLYVTAIKESVKIYLEI